MWELVGLEFGMYWVESMFGCEIICYARCGCSLLCLCITHDLAKKTTLKPKQFKGNQHSFDVFAIGFVSGKKNTLIVEDLLCSSFSFYNN